MLATCPESSTLQESCCLGIVSRMFAGAHDDSESMCVRTELQLTRNKVDVGEGGGGGEVAYLAFDKLIPTVIHILSADLCWWSARVWGITAS